MLRFASRFLAVCALFAVACLPCRASYTRYKQVTFGAAYGGLTTVGYALYAPGGTLTPIASTTTTANLVASTTTNLAVSASSGFSVNDTVQIDTGGALETRTVSAVPDATHITISVAVTSNHTAPTAVADVHTLAGISELGTITGTYAALVGFPSSFTGEIRWDTGGSSPVYASEVINPGGSEYMDAAVSAVPASLLAATVDSGALGTITVKQSLFLNFVQTVGKFGTPVRSTSSPWTITVPFLRMDGTTTGWTIITTYSDSTFTKTTGRSFTLGTLP